MPGGAGASKVRIKKIYIHRLRDGNDLKKDAYYVVVPFVSKTIKFYEVYWRKSF